MIRNGSLGWLVGALFLVLCMPSGVTKASAPAPDGAHDFDFLLGDWTAHARQLPDRPNAARMEQSYSDDGGTSWELNWVCELTR